MKKIEISSKVPKISPIVISYYTKNTIYEKEAEALINTCKELGLEYQIDGVLDKGSWEANCSFKPTFILQKLHELKKPLMWVDCDAVIIKKPEIFDCDISLAINEKLDAKHHSKVFAGTIFINYNLKSINFIKNWKKIIATRTKKKDKKFELLEQESLRDAYFLQKELNVKSLPKGYSFIFDDLFTKLSLKEVFIVHFQASRLRFLIKDEIRNLPFFYHNIDEFELKLMRQRIKILFCKKKSAIKTYEDFLKKRSKIS